MGGTGFEPVKAMPTDLQSAPFNHSGNLPRLVTFSITQSVCPLGQLSDELVEGLEPTTC